MSENSGHARTSGILSIVSGIIGIIIGLFCVAGGVLFFFMFTGRFGPMTNEPVTESMSWIFMAVYGMMGLIIMGLGILAIVGGNYSLKRKRWGLALAGAISGSIVFYYTGIIAVIYVCLSKSDFEIAKPEISGQEGIQGAISPPASTQI